MKCPGFIIYLEIGIQQPGPRHTSKCWEIPAFSAYQINLRSHFSYVLNVFLYLAGISPVPQWWVVKLNKKKPLSESNNLIMNRINDLMSIHEDPGILSTPTNLVSIPKIDLRAELSNTRATWGFLLGALFSPMTPPRLDGSGWEITGRNIWIFPILIQTKRFTKKNHKKQKTNIQHHPTTFQSSCKCCFRIFVSPFSLAFHPSWEPRLLGSSLGDV